MLKRGHYGTYHQMFPQHLQRYVNELVGRHNDRHLDMETQTEQTAKALVGRDITYNRLIRRI